MSYDTYHKRKIGKHVLKPETQMMGYGFDPSLSEGSLKPPIFLTSTFVFKTAQDGKDFFDYTSGRREPLAGQSSGLVYSRFNNPNLEVLEDRLALWEEGEADGDAVKQTVQAQDGGGESAARRGIAVKQQNPIQHQVKQKAEGSPR